MTKPIVVEENGRKFTLLVKKSLTAEKVRVDDGIIKCKNTKKCDWAILVNSNNNSEIFFIELKGVDLKQAIEQLESTILKIGDFHCGYASKQAHAVCSKIIPGFVSSAQVKAVIFKKKYGFTLRWHSQSATIKSMAA